MYESPETNEFVDKETECEEDGFANRQDNTAKERNFLSEQTRITDEVEIDEKQRSKGLLKFNRSLGDEQENQSLDEVCSHCLDFT